MKAALQTGDATRRMLRDAGFADEMRRLRLDLAAAYPQLRTLMVIGAAGGEGVSTVVQALLQQFADNTGGSAVCVDLASRVGVPDNGDALAHWRARIDELRTQHELVLIDAPPATRESIGLALAPHVDAVLIVVECDRTRLDTLDFMREKFEAAGARIAGSVLNRTGRWLPSSWWRRVRRRRTGRDQASG